MQTLRKRPLAGSATGRVWAIADEMFTRSGQLPSGRAVVDAYLAENPEHNEGTGFTQFSHWKKAHLEHFKRGRRRSRASALVPDADGRVTLPLELLRKLDLAPGEGFVASVEGRTLRLVPAGAALDRARAVVRAFDTGSGSPVDELLAERRAE